VPARRRATMVARSAFDGVGASISDGTHQLSTATTARGAACRRRGEVRDAASGPPLRQRPASSSSACIREALDGRYHASIEFWPPGQKVDSYTTLTLQGPACDTEREAMVLGTRAAERWIDRQALLGR
jgi:hypothetical protein